jgi:signal transduction histidine kinase
MRGGGRLVRSVVALCLPTAVVVLLGIRFLVQDVPALVRDEKSRVLAESERAAKAMREEPLSADFVWTRGRGVVRGVVPFGDYPADMSWKDWNPESGTKRRDMWGWRSFDGGRLVWARGVGEQDGETVYARRTDIAARDYATLFFVSVPLFLLVLVVITALGAKFLVDYVRARDDFMAAAAHDLATPLVAMRMMIGCDDDEAKNLNERLIRLVANIKDFLRLGGRRPAPQPTAFDLRAAYGEAYALFRADYRDLFDGADVAVTGPSDVRARADPTLTVQILWNLFGNDLKYAAPYGRVLVAVEVRGDVVAIAFRDEGKGMTAAEMRRAFDRYYRAKTVLESGKGGFGIGLCTAREFARAMGGDLTVAPNRPRGCVFTLTLPRAV